MKFDEKLPTVFVLIGKKWSGISSIYNYLNYSNIIDITILKYISTTDQYMHHYIDLVNKISNKKFNDYIEYNKTINGSLNTKINNHHEIYSYALLKPNLDIGEKFITVGDLSTIQAFYNNFKIMNFVPIIVECDDYDRLTRYLVYSKYNNLDFKISISEFFDYEKIQSNILDILLNYIKTNKIPSLNINISNVKDKNTFIDMMKSIIDFISEF